MIQVTCIRNPFDPLDSREVRKVHAGYQIRELVRGFNIHPGYDVAVSVDGRVLQSPEKMEYIPNAGSSVVFCAVPAGGDGKNPLAIVAALALMIAAPYAGGLLASAYYGTGITMAQAVAFSSTTAAIAYAGQGMALVAGGLAIQSLFPMTQPDFGGGGAITASPTYSWDTGQNSVVEGVSLPEVFGTCRVLPPIIGNYVETSGNAAQYLNLLLAVAQGPVDSITDVRINETAVATFGGVSPPDTRLGTITQQVLRNFNDTKTDTLVNALLSTDWTTRSTSGNSVTGFGVTIAFPQGLFEARGDGSLGAYTVKMYLEYSITGADSWTRLRTYNRTEETVTTARWSGGYWNYPADGAEPVWIEHDVWDSTPPEPVEGQPYESDIWVHDSETNTDSRMILTWHQIENTVIYKIWEMEVDYFGISNNSASALHYYFYKDGLPANGYDVRVALVEDTPESAYIHADAYFDYLTEIVPDDFTYPGTALLSLHALANEQLSGSVPKVDCLVTRSTVPVWSGAAYTAKPANNPAWACYHILHGARSDEVGGYDVGGVPASRIDYAAFQSWAAWCTQKDYTVNLYVDQSMSVRKALDIIATNGRGCVVQMGSKFSCVVDRSEQTPVQRFLFTTGNIVADSFQEEWLPVTDRANAIEVTFFDSELDYSRQVVTIYAQDFDTAGHEINTLQATLYGCVDRTTAIKYGKFLINSNKYLTLTCSFEADVDAIACIPGDVIEVAHDVPQWGYGGRVVSATGSAVTIDREVTIEGGKTYQIMVKHQDDDAREIHTLDNAPGTYSTFAIIGSFTKVPVLHAIYSIGEVDHVVKEFRVLRISRSQELRRKITCLEYVAEIYEDGATIPEPESDSDLPAVTGLKAEEVYRGGAETKCSLTWRGFAMYWNVYQRVKNSMDGSRWGYYMKIGEAYSPSYEIGGLTYGVPYEYSVSVGFPLEGETVAITFRGKIDPPGHVMELTATPVTTSNNFSMLVEWSAVADFDLWGYELRVEPISEPYPFPNFVSNWTGAAMLFKGNALSYSWVYKTAGSYCLHVRAVDAFGNVSLTSNTLAVTIGGPSKPTGSYSFSGPNAVLSWDVPASYFAIDYYAIAYGDDYGSAVATGTTKGTTFSINVTWGGTRRYWIAGVDIAGNVGTPESIDVEVISPGAVTGLTPKVIDNNVLLYWTAPTTGSLPIAYYEVSKGEYYEVSEPIGTVQGTFSTVFEDAAGSNTYWIVAVDTAYAESVSALNKGTPVGIPATVNQPPDYTLLVDWQSTFTGMPTSALVYEGKLYAPVNITETIEEHFVNNTNDSPQDQIDAGYPLWIQPVPTTATYQEVFDYGALISALTRINLEVAWGPTYGEATITPSIEVSTDNVTYGTAVEAYTATESGFRYVRVTLTVAGTGSEILQVDSLRVRLDLKQKTDEGRVEVATNGVTVNFNESFVDILSITVTPESTSNILAVYDFTDVPNPTHFHIYLFNPTNGADASGAGKYVSWIARGL